MSERNNVISVTCTRCRKELRHCRCDEKLAKRKELIEQRENIVKFLEKNGWVISEQNGDCTSFYKDGNIGIDVCLDEVVLIGNLGDFCHIPIDNFIVETLLGYLISRRLLDITFKWGD